MNPSIRRVNLSLPQGYNPRAVALAGDWRRRLGDDQRIVQAALDLFNAQFTYTLLAPPLGRNTMDDFLFETRAGYCEHFSSAFVVLMRAAGIPARVVVGYQGGYWNTIGQYLIVRQSDAHAWAEVWSDRSGWIRVDPTGAVSPARIQLGSRAASAGEGSWFNAPWLLQMRNRWDLVNRLWNKAVVQFGALQQKGLLTRFGIDRADWNQLAIAFGISCCALLGIGLLWAMRRDAIAGDALDRHYARLGRKLARAGWIRPAAEGPRRFAARLGTRIPRESRQLIQLLDQYVTLRYAQATPDAVAVQQFAASVREFRAPRAFLTSRDDS